MLSASIALVAIILLVPPAHSMDRPLPEALKDWATWATWDDIHRNCPSAYSDSNKHLCVWPSRLGLQVTASGGQFDVAVQVFGEDWISLPGGSAAWPMNVKVNGAPVAVVEHEHRPAVKLPAGTYRLEGEFHWNAVPQRISIPREIGLLALIVEGKPVETPSWDERGDLWLKRSASVEEVDKNSLSTKVYAAVADGIPLWLHTEVELIVSGKSREEQIGIVVPEGWKVASVGGPIPAVVDETGHMKAQVRSGRWTVRVSAFRLDQPKEFHYAAGAKPAATEELVAFQAKPDFRTVEIVGPSPVDVSQTTFPEQWRGLPVYKWDTSTPFEIQERLRGMGQQKIEGLRIQRELWLDEGGREFTFRDAITGNMQQLWRLDAAPGQELGSVRSDGAGQLITRNPQNGVAGVEVRTRQLNLEATGRMPRRKEISATGWQADADALRLTLNLPPGWRLLALFGADWVRGDWLTAWTLLDLFLLLVFTFAVFRMWGFASALLAFLAFGLSYHEPDAPRFLWLILLVPLALQRVVPEGWGRRIVNVGKWIVVLVFVLFFIPFVAGQVVQALYPQLESTEEYGGTHMGSFVSAPSTSTPDFASSAPGYAPAEPMPQTTDRIRYKLDHIILPKLEFREATVREAVDFLRQKSVELDDSPASGERGVNFVPKVDLNTGSPTIPPIPTEPIPGVPGLDTSAPHPVQPPTEARITVSLTHIPLGEALKYVTGLANLKYRITPNGVEIVPLAENTDVLITKEWRIRPDLIPNALANPDAAKEWLTSNGVSFNGAASATYIPKDSRLVVRNTQDQFDLIDTIVGMGQSPAAPAAGLTPGLEQVPMDAAPGRSWRGYRAPENLNYDAKARIQTGPGVPDWKWREVSFGWNGPVTASQRVHPVLISLATERVLTVLRVALLLLLAMVLLGVRKAGGAVFGKGAKAALWISFALLTSQAMAQTSQIPDSSTLSKLRERLLEASDAYPHAADIPSVTLTLKDGKVVMDAEIHAALGTAVPLPGPLPAWSPISVLVDDKPEVSMRREDGYLWLLIMAGVHHVHVEGSLANVSEWEWTYLLAPHQVKVDAPDWNVSGIRPDGVPQTQVILSRKEKAAAAQASYEQQAVQAIVTVERQIELGLTWQMHTTVQRLSPRGKAVALRIPLVAGESVLTPGAVVKDGVIEVRLGAQDSSFSWDGELAVTKQLQLATRVEDTWVERWHLLASPVWNVTLSGLPPVFESSNSLLQPVWYPWPGEKIELAVSRPEAIPGATVTVDRTSYDLALGKRQRTSQLNLTLRCSLGEDFLIDLPPDAEITTLTQDNTAIPVRKNGSKVIVPVHPGEQKVAIAWKRNVNLDPRATTDEVRLPVEAANIQTTMTVPADRWVLWASGPQRGPAVRFWGILVCSLLAAVALGRMARTPMGSLAWMLLVIGLTQVSLPAALTVVGWLFFVAWRGSDSFQRLANWSYNLLQLLLIPLTVAALSVLVLAVREGLLGRPEMSIAGNESTQSSLHWFQPRSDGLLPRGECVSVSIWWYRLFMLVWALWLAMALIRWLQMAWKNFGTGGYFHRKPKPAPVAQTPPAPPSPPPVPTQS